MARESLFVVDHFIYIADVLEQAQIRFLIIIFFMYGPAKKTTLNDGKYKQDPRAVIIILIANADNIA